MLKKLTIIIAIITLLPLTGCSSKYTVDMSHMPEGLREKHETQLSEFEQELKTLEDGDPREATVLFNIGYKHEQLGNYKKALRYYNKVLKMAPLYYQALNNTANIYSEVGEYEKALQYFDTIYESFPTTEQIIINVVDILIKNGEHEKAMAALEEFIIQSSKDGNLNNAFANDLREKISEAQASE